MEVSSFTNHTVVTVLIACNHTHKKATWNQRGGGRGLFVHVRGDLGSQGTAGSN